MINGENNEVELRQIARTLWRGKVAVLFFATLTLLLGGIYAFVLAVPIYTSEAMVALESRQDQVVDIESVVTGLAGDQATINTEVEVMRSRGLIEKVVRRLDLLEDPEFNENLRPDPAIDIGALVRAARETVLGPQPEPAPQTDRSEMEAVIDSVLLSVSVSNIRQSYVFKITVATESAEKSAELANTLAELYILEQLESKFEATEQATNWLTERVAQLQVQLEDAEATVKNFNAGVDLVSPEALTGLNRQIKELRDRLRDIQQDRMAEDERLAALNAAKQAGDIATMAEAANDPTLNRVKTLLESENSTLDRSTFDDRFDQVIARSTLEIARADAQITTLQSTIAEQEAQIERQSVDLVKLQQLQREADASRLIYEFFLGRLKETSVQEGIQRADSRILSRAVVPPAPSAPRIPLILALSLIFGLFVGAGLVILREFSQNTFRESSELEQRTGYPVIGQIPVVPARRRKNVLQYLKDKPTSAAAEAIRNLRTSVLLSNIDNPPQVIMSTSSVPAEGKTTQSLALSQNLAGLGKRVLLIEGDIRKSVFGEYFEVEKKEGMLSVLSGQTSIEDAVVTVPDFGADVLLGERSRMAANAADIFSSERFGTFINELRAKYDYIVIDSPPVLAVPDARIIGQSVDAVLYTVKWDSTPHRQVSDGLKALELVNVQVAGLVLNQINARGMRKYGYADSYTSYNAYYEN